jgi:hypothetical protein
MTDPLEIVARQLALDAATVEVTDVFATEGIRAILLKGAAIARRLYESPEQRPYGDIDLLIQRGQAQRAQRLLARLGFANVLAGVRPHELAVHATPWHRDSPSPATVDLHTTLAWCPEDPAAVWCELSRETTKLSLGDGSIETLSDAAQAFVIAAHAVQHGDVAHPREDLERAVLVFDGDTWRRAAELARRLDAEAVLAAGLGLSTAGRALAPELGLGRAEPTSEMRLRMSGAKPASLTLLRLAEAGSLRAQIALTFRRAFPSRAYMRKWLAERGREMPLVLAYLYRSAWIGRRLPSALAALRRSRRAAPSRRRRCRPSPRRSG